MNSSSTMLADEVAASLAKDIADFNRAQTDLPFLISKMSGRDERDGTRFTFEHIATPLEPGEVSAEGNKLIPRDKSWRWQRYVVDQLLSENRWMALKGRQIGVTWIVLAVDVAEAITIPGSTSLLFRQREDEAIDNVRRWWVLYQSLPKIFTEHIKVTRPDKTDRPGRDGVSLRFPDGSFSDIVPMTSSATSGHGRSVRRVILDESAHIEKLSSIRAAVEPAAGRAKINMISTANGLSNPETGEGNEFHRLWTQGDTSGYVRLFLPYDVHPDRDEAWYESAPEVQSLRVYQRQEQFPRDEHEAFALSDRSFFDGDALLEYGSPDRIRQPKYRHDFEMVGPKARKVVHAAGNVRVLAEPNPDHSYAIGADVATGRGRDYSAAFVIDLTNMELVAEYNAKVEADVYARDLHFLGKRYNTAKIAVETAGGYGEAVIIALRDGVTGRPRYPNLYRHVMSSRTSFQEAKTFGFPTNTKTRPLILNQMEQAIREKTLPWVSDDLLYEMKAFIYRETGPSPAARDGSRDDRVMACAITLEMFRLYGNHPARKRRRAKRGGLVGLGQGPARVVPQSIDESRYAK